MRERVIGIDKIGVYIPPFYIDMEDLADERGEDPEKYTVGLGQDKMAVPPVTQDAVSMGANAALQILDDEDRKKIDLVILATESGVDKSKAGAVYLHDLLDIQPFARSIELKQACYSGTAGLQAAVDHVRYRPDSKVLLVTSDIAKYGIGSSGETTQGAGAVAMLISSSPRLAVVSDRSLSLTRNIMDFWKPNYLEFPEVKGHYSSMMYLEVLSQVWDEFQERYQVSIDDYELFLCHLPFTKLGEKALRKVMKGSSDEKKSSLKQHYEHTRYFSRNVGNVYTGSLYLGLASSLVCDESLEARDSLLAFSYGSGAVGEMFELELVDGYRGFVASKSIQSLFEEREKITISDYEKQYNQAMPTDGSDFQWDLSRDSSPVVLAGIKEHERQYLTR